MRSAAIVVILALGIAACGSSGGDGIKKDCETTMTLLCDKACACSSDETCHVGQNQGGVLYNDTRQDCLDWYVTLLCSQADKAPAGFFDTCLTALDSAGCLNGTDEGLDLPDACIAE